MGKDGYRLSARGPHPDGYPAFLTCQQKCTAPLFLDGQFEKADNATRKRIYDLYLANTEHINNWDLVDLSGPKIVGSHLETRSRKPLDRLAKSASLWERRISIIATGWFIWRDDFADTLKIAEKLLNDEEDLIHKAVGWMLREVGKRDEAALGRVSLSALPGDASNDVASGFQTA